MLYLRGKQTLRKEDQEPFADGGTEEPSVFAILNSRGEGSGVPDCEGACSFQNCSCARGSLWCDSFTVKLGAFDAINSILVFEILAVE
jgi:hypothetical protein